MRLIGTLATDSLTRDYTQFTPGALAFALQENWEMGIPSLVAHDMARPVGWTYPTAMYFSRNGCRLTGELTVPDADDMDTLLVGAMRSFLASQLAKQREDIDALRRLLGTSLCANSEPLVVECVALYDEDIALLAARSVFDQQDGDGLVEVADLEALGPGVFRHGALALFAHRAFRRGGTPLNTLNAPFLERLQQLPNDLRPRVALDPDMVGLAASYRPRLEHQYWWGPEFNEDLTKIRPGVTQHGATPRERFFSGIERTDFRWGDRDDERIFEVEELREFPTFDPAGERYACRYCHAIAGPDGRLGHFDGAVRLYDADTIIARRSADIAHAGRALGYQKLWRLDGGISVPRWKRLLSDYFRDNHLIGEYLGAPAEARFGPIPEADDKARRGKDLAASFRLTRGSGVRAGLSFRTLPERVEQRHIWPAKSLDLEGQRSQFIEQDSLELVKCMAREHQRVELASDILIYMVNDLDVNLATVWHPELGDVRHTVAAIGRLAEAWQALWDDRLFAFSIAYPLGRTAVMLSVSGHVADVLDFIKHWGDDVQPTLAEPGRLADTLKALIGDGPADEPRPDALACLTVNRILEIDRLELRHELYDLHEDDRGLKIEFVPDLSEYEDSLADAIKAGRVRPVVGAIVEHSDCSLCGQLYRACPCSKLLDPGCFQRIRKAAPIAVYLTPRPAG